MTVICLFAQPKERYAGEYAPDLRGAIDERGNDENPDYLNNMQEELKKDSSVAFTRRIVINVPDEDFNRVFYGEGLRGTLEKVPAPEVERRCSNCDAFVTAIMPRRSEVSEGGQCRADPQPITVGRNYWCARFTKKRSI